MANRRFLLASLVAIALPRAAAGQAVDIRTDDAGAASTSRLQFATGASPADITVMNARLKLNSSGAYLNVGSSSPTSSPGDVRYSGGVLYYHNGTTEVTLSTGSASDFVQNQTAAVQSASFRISGTGQISGSASTQFWSSTTASSGIAIRGTISGSGSGGKGLSSAHTATGSGSHYGVEASVTGAITTTSSDNKFGMYSRVSGSAYSNRGLDAYASGSTYNYGVLGQADSQTGPAATDNWGVYARARGAGTRNRAVDAYADLGTTNYGLYAVAAGASGQSAYGLYASVSGASETNYAVDLLNSSTGTGSQFGLRSTVSGSGASFKYGAQAIVSGSATTQ